MKDSSNVIAIKGTVKKKTAATLIAVAAAVILPQLVHLAGIMSGTGKSLGETLLPMHLPIMLVGFIAGPAVGLISGMLSPLISFALTAMPSAFSLPFMCIELMTYGLFAGLLSNVKLPVTVKLISVMAVGRVARILAMLFSVYILGITKVSVTAFIGGITTGTAGILIQLLLIPFLLYHTNKRGEI